MSSRVMILVLLPAFIGSNNSVRALTSSPVFVSTVLDTVHMEKTCEYDLTGDGTDEFFKVTVTGTDWQKMEFRLIVTSARGDSLFSDEWTSQWYFATPLTFDPFTPEGGERLIRMRLDGMFDEGSFHLGFPYGRTSERKRGILQRTIREEIGTEATEERINTLIEEVEKATCLVYLKGNEDVAVLAWSPSEQRIIQLVGFY